MSGDVRPIKPRVGGPASGSWPPFEKGHTLSMKHGATSPRRVDPIALETFNRVIAEAERSGSDTAYLATASYRPAVLAWARCEARVQLLNEYLARFSDYNPETGQPGDIDEDGNIRPAANLLYRYEASALKHRERLGLDPLARARLGRDVAAGSIDMAKLMAQLDDDASDEIPTTATDDGDDVG